MESPDDVQRRLDAPVVAGIAAKIEQHGDDKIGRTVAAFPSLSGDYSANIDYGDQFEMSQISAYPLVDKWLASLHPKVRAKMEAVRMAEDESELSMFDPTEPQPDLPFDTRTFGYVANLAFQDYCREFASGTRDPRQSIDGFALESDQSVPATPDTRVYAVMARWPFERKAVMYVEDLKPFFASAHELRMCDLRLTGGICEGLVTAESTLVPIVRYDLIVLVAVCADCLKRYCKNFRGVKGGKLIAPGDALPHAR